MLCIADEPGSVCFEHHWFSAFRVSYRAADSKAAGLKSKSKSKVETEPYPLSLPR